MKDNKSKVEMNDARLSETETGSERVKVWNPKNQDELMFNC